MANDPIVPPSAVTQVPKDWYKSTTLWWNVAASIYNVLEGFGIITGALAIIPQPYGAVVQGVVNIFLRFLRPNEPIIGTPPAKG